MNEVSFYDSTLRDGPQSLWASRITAPEMLSIAPTIDRAGYKGAEGPTLNSFIVYLRYLRENPWEKIDLLCNAMPNTPVTGGMRSTGAWGFDIQPDCIIELYLRRLIAHGYRGLCVFDALHDFSRSANMRRIAKAAGIEVELCLVYALSPVHTDEYYAGLATELAKMDDVDLVRLKDSMGLLTPDRVRTLVPVILKNLGGKPLLFHSHCTAGVAPQCYVEAVKLGVRNVQTCVSPLANGNSIPSTEQTLKNIQQMGYTSTLDNEALETIAAHFRNVAKRGGKPIGCPVEYDLYQYEHQIPGGMRSNLESQLAMRGELDRLDEVLEEVALVRKEMGYVVLITPLAQIIGVQAVMNVLTGERYRVVVEELYKYVLGFYGATPVSIDPDVKDRILSSPRGKEYLKWQPPQPTVQDLRRKLGGRLSDDDLLLQLMHPEEDIRVLLASGPLKTDYPCPGLETNETVLIGELAKYANVSYVHCEKGDLSITLQRNQPQSGKGNTSPAMTVVAARGTPGASSAVAPQPAVSPAADCVAVPEAAAPPSPSQQTPRKEGPAEDATVAIVTPIMGRFYAKPEPGAVPFVSVGSEVNADTVVGLVEVMKVFTAVRACVTGVITEICVQDAALIEYGHVLFRVRPAAKPLDALRASQFA